MSTLREFLRLIQTWGGQPRRSKAPEVTVIPDGDNQARTSEVDGETFVLGHGDSTTVDGEPVLTFADDRVTFRNAGSANTTGDTATVSIEGDRGTVKNFRGAEITAEETAIDISGEDALIHNRGTISGGFNGVNFVNGGESSGTLRNYGTVSSDSRAVNIGGEDIRVDNYGHILGTGDQRNGTVYSDATADEYEVNNFRSGVIDAGEGNQGAGIAFQLGEEVEGSIYNSGVIQGRGQAPALNPDGTPNGLAGDGIRLFSGVEGPSTFEGDITNFGRILSESEQGPVAALRVANGVGFDGTITNGRSGVIDGVQNGLYFGTGEHDAEVDNYGLIASDSRAVNIDGTGVELNNYGRILGTDDQRNGTVYADGTADEYEVNNFRGGVIDAGKGNDGAGVAFQLGEEVEASIYNAGVIQGRGQAPAQNPDGSPNGLAGDGIRLFSGVEGPSTFEGDITNFGRILSESEQGPVAALRVANGVGFEGTITNGRSGVIDGVQNGLYFGTGEHDAEVDNYGLIASDSRAVNIDGTGVELNNYGRILGTGDQRNGTVYADGTADEYEVNNFRGGVIDAGKGNDGAGVAFQLGEEVEASIYNAGVIQGRGQAPAQNPDGSPNGLAGDGIRLFSGVEGPSTFEGDITNFGRILSESEQGPVAALRVANGVGFEGTITNGRSGVIDGVQNGLYFGTGEHDAEVDNYGLIASDSRAVNIDGTGVELNNYGRILGTGDQRNGTVYADATAEDYEIFNGRRGVIDAGKGNLGSGVSLQTGDEDGDVVEARVVNYGTIAGRGNGEGNLLGHGVRVFSGVTDGTPIFRGDILNYGRITTEEAGDGLLTAADGISVEQVVFEGDVRNSGRIDAGDDGIEADADTTFIGDIVNDGRIEAGDDGIFLDDAVDFTGNIINNGRIVTEDEGVELDPNVVFVGDIVNNDRGRIDVEDDGIFLSSGVDFTGDIVNDGRIEADEFGIFITNIVNFDGEIVNRGTITGDADGDGIGEAINASFAPVDLTVVNEGVLNGDVLLGSGNDVFDGADGRVNGEIDGGGGEDQIVGGEGDDRINGGSGNDTLTGGEDTDTFVFEQGTGSDTVTDFAFADERLDVAAFFADQGTALAAARQDGDDTVIDLDVAAGDEVRLVGVDVNDLQTDNFIV